jgi:hypothetical protein
VIWLMAGCGHLINKAVASITVNLYAHPVFSGTVTSWTASAQASSHVYNNAQVYQFQYVAPTDMSASGTTLTSNTDVFIKGSTANIAYLDTDMWGKPDGTYYLGMALNQPLTMTLAFDNGQSQTLSAPTADTFYWYFRYTQGTFYSLGASWGIAPNF